MLTVKELKELRDRTVVWCWYRRRGELHLMEDGPLAISKQDDGSWLLEDGAWLLSSEFMPSEPDDDSSPCVDELMGEGEIRLYKAVWQ